MAYSFGTMRCSNTNPIRWFASLALVFAATSCAGHPVQRQLAGRWIGDGVENVRDEALASATGWARGTSLEFAGRHVTVTIPAEEPRTAQYRVVTAEGRDVKLEVLREDGGTDALALRLDEEHRIRWLLGSGSAIVLHRER